MTEMNKKKLKVFVAMSGGVDSSVAAALLKKEGYEVIGVHMKCYNLDGCGERDAEDARRAAEHLNIPFYVFDFEKEYKDRVVKYMIDSYKKGITPNPDVMCNKEIKFGLFLEKALKIGADFVATGHYVKLATCKIRHGENASKSALSHVACPISLCIARDRNKDQSYFLWTLTHKQLKHCLFPIGGYTKPQVRKIAAKFGLHNALKKDSQGICFLGQISLPDFLKKYIKQKKGDILLITSGSDLTSSPTNYSPSLSRGYIKIGIHNGVHLYTIGQRHGLNIGGYSKPLYVSEKNIKKNIVYVAEGENHPALYKKEVNLVNVNFQSLILNRKSFPVYARVRYRQPLEKATLQPINSSTAQLKFDRPVKFVAEGQSAVFYDKKGAMLGGGIIVY